MGRSPCCEKAHTTKGGWTTEEDCQLVGYILAHGVGCWRSLPKAAGLRRSGKSCRSRWMNYLRPDIKRGNFTEEEVELIIKLHSLLGNRWSFIASRLPGRTDNEIKNQWNTRIRRKFLSLGIDPTTHRPIYKPPQEVKGDGSRSPTKIESSQIGRIMQLDSSCQESIRVPDHINGAYLVSVDQDVFAGARKQGQEIISTKQDIGANYVPHSLPQQSIVVDDMNGERVIRTKQDNANGSRKQGKIWTLDREYGISREVLEQYSEKKLKDVAVILGVSRSTLKRICRKHHIFRWPPCKAKRFGPSVNPQASIHVTQRQIEDQSLIDQSLHDLPLDGQDTSSIIVKATYGDDMLKFQLSLSSRKLDLEEQVAMRLNLSVGSFKIKYLDEDEDWVLVACDADLRACISTLRSLGKTTIKMQIC